MDLGGGTTAPASGGGQSKRMDAIKLAKVSKWDELRRLVDAEPLTAQQTDSYGMLPLHWACTEPHSIGDGVLMALLKAYPQGARVLNTAEMLPLQIAIKAQAKIEWLQALLASYPDAVLRKTPTGDHAVELAKRAELPARSVRLLEEMYLHVCQKAGYSSDHLYDDQSDHHDQGAGDIGGGGGRGGGSAADEATAEDVSFSDHQLMLAGQAGAAATSSRGGAALVAGAANRTSRQPSNPDAFKARAYSYDNEFQNSGDGSNMVPYVRGVSTSSTGSGSGGGNNSGSGNAAPLPYQVSTRLSSRTVVSLPPRWKNAPNCYICSQKWSTPFRKRHHCRNCGESICGDHSARERMRLAHYGLPDKYRVCTRCHQTLRSAPQELLQPSHARLTTTASTMNAALPARRSDEALASAGAGQRGSAGHMSMSSRGLATSNSKSNATGGGNFQLERHVSAPARPMVEPEYHGIHDQVASLQMQVSQLMEQREIAESQLRAQAELLGESYPLSDTRRTGNGSLLANGNGNSGNGGAGGMGRRTRLNSVPVTLPSGGYPGAGSGSGGVPGSYMAPPPAPAPSSSSSSFGGSSQSAFYSFEGSHHLRSTGSSTDRETDIDDRTISMSSAVPEPPTSSESTTATTAEMMARLQDDLGSMSFVSSYSEFDDRSTEIYDDHDHDPHSPMSGGFLHHSGVLEEGNEDLEEEEDVDDDEDDDDDGDVGDSTLPEVEVLVNLGLAMLNKGSCSAAVQAFTRAVEICPDTAVLYSYLAKAQYADDNLDEAVVALEKSLELEPSAANSTLLGKILFEKGDHERAIEAYQKSLEYQK